jgi:Glycosyl hydrolases family 28
MPVVPTLAITSALTNTNPATVSTLATSGATSLGGTVAHDLRVYQTPPGYQTDGGITMTVNGQNVPVLKWTTGKNNAMEYLYSRFSLGGSATVKISCSKIVDSCRVQPAAFGIQPQVSGHDVTFTLQGSRYFIITINNSNLMVLADPPESTEVRVGDAKTFSLPASADSSGSRNCTDLLQNLIDSASARGGGVAYIPYGTFRVGPFHLKSNVTLYLADGASLKFDTSSPATTKDFGKVIHHDHERVHPGVYFIKADDAQNIRIAGRGIIDLNGGALFDADGRLDSCMRMQNVKSLDVEGVTIRENSSWSLLIAGCRNVSFRNVKVLNGMGFEQNDAFDIISSQDVLIEHCFAYGRDDSYCLKGGGPGTHGGGITTRETRDFGNITVQDCVAYTRDGSGFKIGNQSSVSGKGFVCKNLYAIAGRNAVFLALFDGPATFEKVVTDSVFIDQKNMIPFKVQIKKGGQVKDIVNSNYFVEMQPIHIQSQR